jgi:hypothetical protein
MKRHGHEVLACLDIPYEEGTQLFIVLSLLVGASIRGRRCLDLYHAYLINWIIFKHDLAWIFYHVSFFFFEKLSCLLFNATHLKKKWKTLKENHL